MPVTRTLTWNGYEVDGVFDLIDLTPPEGSSVPLSLAIGFQIGAVRAPVSPPPAFPAPVAYWPFDGDGSDAVGSADMTGGTYGTGKFGQALTGGFGSGTQSALTGPRNGDYTIGGWFRTAGGMSSSGGVSVGGLSITCNQFTTGASAADIGMGALSVSVSGAGLPLNTWVHIAVVAKSGVMTLYRDGVAGNSASTAALQDSFNTDVSAGVYLTDVDELAAFTPALTADQVAAWAAGTQTIAQLAGL